MRWLIELGLFLIVVGCGYFCYKAFFLPVADKGKKK